jgi:UDP-3-O-[3-hydroxymyristoyl] glucosamine N-acyltransferase
MQFTASELAKHLDGEVAGDASLVLKAFAPADRAKPGDLTFAENEAYFRRAEESHASAIIVDGPFQSERKTLIRVANARVAFARILPLFSNEPVFAAGRHPTALVDPTAQVDPSAHLGPYCVVEAEVRIGPRVVLQGMNYVGAQSQIGEETILFPHVTLYPRTEIGCRVRIHSGSVIGSDGFGYVPDGGAHRKVLQIGTVIIEDDVEIGANVTVDRGALGATVIGKGSKIDNLVQIAHNVTIGEHCLLISQVGIAGSTRLGSNVTLGGQVGLAGHLKLGKGAAVQAQSGVMNDIPEGETWLGTPAQPGRQAKRQMIAAQHLPELLRRVAALEKQAGIRPKA